MSLVEIETKVAGVTFKNGDGVCRQEILEDVLDELTHNGPFDLVVLRDHENPHDPNAIAILDPKWRQLGFLNRNLAGKISRLIDLHGENLKLTCVVDEVTGLELDSHYGLNIKLRYFHPDSR